MPLVFTVFLLSGVILMTSGAWQVITTRTPFDTLELCEAAAAQVHDAIAMRDDVQSASWECRPHDLPIPMPITEPLAPMREAR